MPQTPFPRMMVWHAGLPSLKRVGILVKCVSIFHSHQKSNCLSCTWILFLFLRNLMRLHFTLPEKRKMPFESKCTQQTTVRLTKRPQTQNVVTTPDIKTYQSHLLQSASPFSPMQNTKPLGRNVLRGAKGQATPLTSPIDLTRRRWERLVGIPEEGRRVG